MNRTFPTRACVFAGTITLILAVAGCESAVQPNLAAPAAAAATQHSSPPPPARPALESRAPRYPALAVYIVYREYLHRNPGLTTLSPDDRAYQNYMEKRLRELYPQRGYAGMMRDAVQEAGRNRAAWLQYERELREYD